MAANVKDKKLFKALVDALNAREEANTEKKLATNAFNKTNTAAKEKFKEFVQTEGLPAGVQVSINGTKYSWEVSTAEVIDPKSWFKLWQDGELTDEQYFEAITVGKDKAKLLIGEDQVAAYTVAKRGETADIRTNSDDADTVKGIDVILPTPMRPAAGIKPRIVPKGHAVQVPAPVTKPGGIRKIILPTRKA